MTASTLSPTEQDEVTRFGIHDDDALRVMAEHFDSELPCDQEACDAGATTRVVMRCCSASGVLCDEHLSALRRRYAFVRVGKCWYCRASVVAVTFEDAFRVVPL